MSELNEIFEKYQTERFEVINNNQIPVGDKIKQIELLFFKENQEKKKYYMKKQKEIEEKRKHGIHEKIH